MPVTEIVEFVKHKAQEFGAKPPDHSRPSYRFRENLTPPFDANQAYFGFVQPDEEPSGAYHDFSFAVMPSEDERPWFVNICVGTMGFQNDHELASRPGLRRMFQRLVDDDGFCKSDFSDIETALPDSIRGREDLDHLAGALDKYSKVFCAGQVIREPYQEGGKKIISAFLAAYARMRRWPTNQAHRAAVDRVLADFVRAPFDSPSEVRELLQTRKFVVLEGAPGTGKTRLAKLIAADLNAKVFFTQFHAETTYSDFVYGILPSLDGDKVGYEPKIGVLAESISHAISNPDDTVLLIVDEINRANLSNVLGPVFYLFEPLMDQVQGVEIVVTPDLKLSSLPPNFHVIGTMNTADRSLAVVDFALRRRFAWYRMEPAPIENDERFHLDDFDSISRIFNWHATYEELSLQPGQAYFLADSREQMKQRIRYELLPLIREYLQEGRLRSAKEDFNKFFLDRIGQPLYD
jgi:5-methylcytosine-specific restriction enzyme B